MKLAVCVKEVVDARVPLQVEAGTGRLAQGGRAPLALINPADRAALEVALRLKRQSPHSRVEAFSVCEAHQQGALYFALARGADYAERLDPGLIPGRAMGPPGTAVLLAQRLAAGAFDLIYCGDESLDNSSAMVGPLIAELLDLPQVTGVSRVQELKGNRLLVERALERGNRELVEVELPALLTCKVEVAEPQYVSQRRLERAAQSILVVGQPGNESMVATLPRWPDPERKVPPRARVKKKFAPDSNLPAAQRVQMIMSGGMAPRPASQNVLEGDPDYLSEQIFRFLKHYEFI